MATPDASAVATPDFEATAPPMAVAEPIDPEPIDPELERRGNLVWAAAMSAMLLSALLLLRFLPRVGWPLVLAVIGAYLLDPLVTWTAHKGVRRPLSSAVLVSACALAVIGAFIVLLPKVLGQVAKIPGHIQNALDILLARMSQVDGQLIPADFQHLLQMAREHVTDILSRMLPGAGPVVGSLVGGSLSLLSSVLGALIVPVVGFYLLKGWPDIVRGTEELVPATVRPVFHRRMKEIDRVLNGFIRGQLTMAAVLAGLYTSGLSVAGVKMAVIIGLVTGFGNLVPYVGSATGLTLTVASSLVDFGFSLHLLVAVAVFLGIMTADSIFITPRVVGDRVGLSPAAVIVAVLTCGSLFGFGGVLLAVPTVAILKVVVRVLVASYKQSRLYTEG